MIQPDTFPKDEPLIMGRNTVEFRLDAIERAIQKLQISVDALAPRRDSRFKGNQRQYYCPKCQTDQAVLSKASTNKKLETYVETYRCEGCGYLWKEQH